MTGARFEGDPSDDGLDDLFAAGEQRETFARSTRGLVKLTPGEARLVDRLSNIATRARARYVAARASVTKAERAGNGVEATGFRRVANAHLVAVQDVEVLRDEVRRGGFQ